MVGREVRGGEMGPDHVTPSAMIGMVHFFFFSLDELGSYLRVLSKGVVI